MQWIATTQERSESYQIGCTIDIVAYIGGIHIEDLEPDERHVEGSYPAGVHTA